jgi:hypothetical protein
MKTTTFDMINYFSLVAKFLSGKGIEISDFKTKSEIKDFVSFVQDFIVPDTANKIVLYVIDLIY